MSPFIGILGKGLCFIFAAVNLPGGKAWRQSGSMSWHGFAALLQLPLK
ncbi:hypothetical protein IFO68_03990 [Photobacterium sp. CAU 1568]|uniref:Uncharacterized protein n=1 Tax=Photobacterium arenosum TaxID=2774143 RepID=A0ABR9BH07_9GAMM|nr:hypothetical protein [Photobacterium arenosum]